MSLAGWELVIVGAFVVGFVLNELASSRSRGGEGRCARSAVTRESREDAVSGVVELLLPLLARGSGGRSATNSSRKDLITRSTRRKERQ